MYICFFFFFLKKCKKSLILQVFLNKFYHDSFARTWLPRLINARSHSHHPPFSGTRARRVQITRFDNVMLPHHFLITLFYFQSPDFFSLSTKKCTNIWPSFQFFGLPNFFQSPIRTRSFRAPVNRWNDKLGFRWEQPHGSRAAILIKLLHPVITAN